MMMLALVGCLAVGVVVVPAGAGAGGRATAAFLKGSSCADPYRVYLGQPRLSIELRLLGDTKYITMHHHELPRAHNNTAPVRRSYTWHGLNGAHMCEFHVWVTDGYLVKEGEPNIYAKPVTVETPLDSHNPSGGKNIVVSFKYRCGPIVCKERDGRVEYHEVLTAAG